MSTNILDADQVIKMVYQPETERLRVDAAITASDITIVVDTDQSTDSIAVYGNDGTTNRILRTDANGELQVDVLSSALPAGAATAARQDTGNASLSSIDSTLSTLNAKFVSGTDIGDVTVNNGPGAGAVNIQDGGNSITVDGTVAATQSGAWTTGRTWTLSSGTDSVASVQSGTWDINNITGTISLPTGASTSANQVTINNSIQALQVTQGSTTSGQSGTLIQGAVTTSAPTYTNGQTNPLSLTTSGALRVDGSGTTQPISGTVTVTQATGTNLHVVVDSGNIIVTATDLDIRNLSAAQDNIAISDGTDTLSVNADGSINITDNGGSLTVDGTVTVNQGTSPWVVSGTVTTSPNVNVHDGTGVSISSTGSSLDVNVTNTVPVSQSGSWTVAATQSGTWNINNISGTISLPAGASTSALQTTGNTSLASIDSKLVLNYGTATQAIRTASQIGNTTGQADFNAGTTTAQTLRVVLPTDQTAIPVTQSGTWTTGRTWTLSSGTDSIASVQSGTWILGANSGIDIGDVTINNTAGAGAVNIQDGGNSITVDGTVTVNQGTSPWVVSGTVTSATSNDTNYGTVGANTLRTAAQIGNATGAALFGAGTTTAQVLRVVLPTDQTAIPVTQSGTWVLGANSGVDIGDVTINNAAGASAVNIQDGGNSITVDGTVAISNFPATVAVTQSTSPWVVSGTVVVSNFPTTVDTNYGTVGANTIRTAAQIGNATGAADFNAGATGAQTLRVVANAGTGNFTVVQPTGTNLHTVVDSGTITVSNFPTTLDTNYGTVGASTLRTAAQIGNATGAANFNAGATGAQTLRTSSNLSDGAGTALTSTLFNSKQSLDVRPNNGFSTASNTRVGVTNASTQLLAANLNRKYVHIFNQSGSIVYLKLGAAAVVNQGIRIANNEFYEITADKLWTGTVNAIVNAGTQTVEIFEGT